MVVHATKLFVQEVDVFLIRGVVGHPVHEQLGVWVVVVAGGIRHVHDDVPMLPQSLRVVGAIFGQEMLDLEGSVMDPLPAERAHDVPHVPANFMIQHFRFARYAKALPTAK